MGAMQADAGTQALLQGQQLDDPWCGEFLLGAQQGAQQELICLGIERGKAEEGVLDRCHLSWGLSRSGGCGRYRSGGRFRFGFGLRSRWLGKQRLACRLGAEQATRGRLRLWLRRGGRRLAEGRNFFQRRGKRRSGLKGCWCWRGKKACGRLAFGWRKETGGRLVLLCSKEVASRLVFRCRGKGRGC